MKNKIVKAFKGLSVAACVNLALAALADPPSNAASPRNSLLMNNLLVVSNAPVLSTNINSFTNLVLSAPFQHHVSVTTMISATNVISGGTNTTGSGAFAYTNFFDLGKVITTNGVSTTNWTTDQPIQVIGNGNGLTPVIQARILNSTNFDSYELIRLTKLISNATNQYTYTVVLGQTP